MEGTWPTQDSMRSESCWNGGSSIWPYKGDNNEPDVHHDEQDPVGYVTQNSTTAASSWSQADIDQRSIHPMPNLIRDVPATGGEENSIESVGNVIHREIARPKSWRHASLRNICATHGCWRDEKSFLVSFGIVAANGELAPIVQSIPQNVRSCIK